MDVLKHYFLVLLSIETGFVAVDGVDYEKDSSLQHSSIEFRYRGEFDS